MHFDTQNTAREVIGFKLEKELVGECDIIDGFMVSEFCIGFQCYIQIEFLLLSKDSLIHDRGCLGTICCQQRS